MQPGAEAWKNWCASLVSVNAITPHDANAFFRHCGYQIQQL